VNLKYTDLLHTLGFERDPFATTNADEEELLQDYFIEPPFFKAVYGDINRPKSTIVFAPRGGGKTALKRRIEIASGTDAFLCVTYNTFPTAGLKLSEIDQAYHLENILRILLVGAVGALTTHGVEALTKEQRHFLYLLIDAHLSKLDRSELESAISSVKNPSQKAKEAWNKALGPVSVVLNAALVHFGFKAVELSKFEEAKAAIGDLKSQLTFVANLLPSLGFLSTYVLIDKVDENVLTGEKASAAFTFVKPVLNDLPLLEMEKLAFKFFLWDRLEEDARTVGRPDRIKTYSLKWSTTQLKEMLSRRLRAHSEGRISSLKMLSNVQAPNDVDELVVILSGGSPRNIIRICKSIFDQQSEIDATANRISEAAFLKGIELIADELASESMPPSLLKDLKKLKKTDFTMRLVYADVFRISQNAGAQKVQQWQDAGAVTKVGTRPEKKGNRPSNIYAIANPIVLKNIFSDMNVLEFWRKKIRFCSACGELMLRDWDMPGEHACHKCETPMASGPQQDSTNAIPDGQGDLKFDDEKA
jgi:hypothetical protein